jgi:hypothetical protein
MSTTNRTHRCRAWSALADLAGLFRIFSGTLADSYRPELHYMRGPGPKWRAKHRPPVDSAFRQLLLGSPEVVGFGRNPGGRRAMAGGSAVRSSAECDLIASILNPNRIFSATSGQETEITNKLVLVFNKFARTMASMGRSPGGERKRNR